MTAVMSLGSGEPPAALTALAIVSPGVLGPDYFRELAAVVHVAVVVEAVGSAARDADRVSWSDVVGRALDREGHHAAEAVDRFLVRVVAMGDRQLRTGWNVRVPETHFAVFHAALSYS